MNHRAEFIFETPSASQIYTVLSPEQGSDPGDKSHVQISCNDDKLLLSIETEDISSMRASLNMWLRLINVSNELLEL